MILIILLSMQVGSATLWISLLFIPLVSLNIFFNHVKIGLYFNFEAEAFGIGLTCWDLQPLQPDANSGKQKKH